MEMKKRQRNKVKENFLSEEELMVVQLFRTCDKVWFTKHGFESRGEALSYGSILGEIKVVELTDSDVYSSKKGKVEVSAFRCNKEVANND